MAYERARPLKRPENPRNPISTVDPTHVALATLAACELLVSWNFKHIVHRDKAPRYNAVNVLRGLPTIGIYSPAEVVRYEEGI